MGKIEEIRKEKLDQLTQRIASQIGVKPTEQELINAAIELAEMHFDEFISIHNKTCIIFPQQFIVF